MLGLRFLGLVGVTVLAVVGAGAGQSSGAVMQRSRAGSAASGAGSSPAAPAAVTRTVSGRVTNAMTGAAIPRSLVNLNSRAALTDAQGRFSFIDFSETQGYLMATKPGFSQSPEQGFGVSQQRILDLDAVQEVKLYPDAIVTGTVTGGDGLPLSRVQVRIRRLTYDASGPRWSPVGFALTDSRGQYRFSQPGGRYRVSTEFMHHSQETGEAVLPVAFPSSSAAGRPDYLELGAGEPREVNLRPKVGPASPIVVKIDVADGRRGVRLGATGSAGVRFRLPTEGRATDGEYRTELPVGTYTIHAILDSRDEPQGGVARVTVTGHGVAEVPLQLSPAATFPVEMVFQASTVAAATSAVVATPPNPRNLNLTLQNRANEGEGDEPDAQVSARADAAPEFKVLPGRYRLTGGRFGFWTVKSATCGATDLLRDDLVVVPGAGGTPIRVVLSNAIGRLHGTVTAAGAPATGWLYLLPGEPSLTPYTEVALQQDGTYRWAGGPGKYTAVVSDHQVHEDFRDARFLSRFSASGRAVELVEGADTAADLTLGAGTP